MGTSRGGGDHGLAQGRGPGGGGKVLRNPWGKGFENQPVSWGKPSGKSHEVLGRVEPGHRAVPVQVHHRGNASLFMRPRHTPVPGPSPRARGTASRRRPRPRPTWACRFPDAGLDTLSLTPDALSAIAKSGRSAHPGWPAWRQSRAADRAARYGSARDTASFFGDHGPPTSSW